jgi:23S rRNA (cytidine1920-2'-O)/16S rRNA (cytidine1409-2'-O)-methyltransferase
MPRTLLDVLRRDFPDVADHEAAVLGGTVRVDRVVRLNPAFQVRPGAHVSVDEAQPLRGEAKLRAAIGQFGVDVKGRIALDVGASAGGFTRVLLEHGALRVYAVDAGHGQLLGSLRQDSRVVNLEATNLGVLTTAHVADTIDLFTVDVSYLSLSAAVAQLGRVQAARDAQLIGLVKPMFELRLPEAPSKADDARVAQALERAKEGIERAGWEVRNEMRSPVRGGHGAQEMLIYACRRVDMGSGAGAVTGGASR